MLLADLLNISITLVIIAHVVVSLLLVLLVLMQRPKQEGLGAAFGAGMTDGMWGARTTDVLQKGTVYMGSLFFILALVLAILVGRANARDSARADREGAVAPAAAVETVEPAPEEPVNVAAEMEEEFKKLTGETPTPEVETPAEVETPGEAEVPVEEALEAEMPAPEVETPAPAEDPAPAEPAPLNE